jgi:hypothetical protein
VDILFLLSYICFETKIPNFVYICLTIDFNTTGTIVKIIFDYFYMAVGTYTLMVNADSLTNGEYCFFCNVGNHPKIVKVGIKQSAAMGIDKNPSSISVNFYSNPAHGVLNIPVNGKKTIAIFNMAGQQVFQSIVEQNTIDVKGIEKGSYFVDAHIGKQDVVQQIDIK